MHGKMGDVFIPFVNFTSTLVYSVVWNQSVVTCVFHFKFNSM